MLFVVVWLLAIASVMLGIFISTFARHEGQVFPFVPLIILPSVFLSGLLVDVAELPNLGRLAGARIPPVLGERCDPGPDRVGLDARRRTESSLAVLAGYSVVLLLLASRTLRGGINERKPRPRVHTSLRRHWQGNAAAGRRQGGEPGRAGSGRAARAGRVLRDHGGLRAGGRGRRPRAHARRAGRGRSPKIRRAWRSSPRRREIPLLGAGVPDVLGRAIAEAYEDLGDGVPVAVRSSATAEDLPTASFAGQQDTYLNVVGAEAVLDAVRRCWASLWTDRAVSYRATNGIDPRGVRLAVVVQRMVDAAVAGVLFTANPVTGRRRQAVIDASPGLGEAVVSGAVNPDHFVVDTADRRDPRAPPRRQAGRRSWPALAAAPQRVELAAASDRASLSDEQVRPWRRSGARVEAHYGAPQDTEWAIDADGADLAVAGAPDHDALPAAGGRPDERRGPARLLLLQRRPGRLPSVDADGHAGVPPPGVGAWPRSSGHPPRDPSPVRGLFAEAAGRLFVDITPVLRSKLRARAPERGDAQHGGAHRPDPRAAASKTPGSLPYRPDRWPVLAQPARRSFARTRIPLRVVRALVRPERRERARGARRGGVPRGWATCRRTPAPRERLVAVERLLLERSRRACCPTCPQSSPQASRPMPSPASSLGDLATDDERRVVMRALPHNPTTEMDLALWALAEEVRGRPGPPQGSLRETPAGAPGAKTTAPARLPPKLQASLAASCASTGIAGWRRSTSACRAGRRTRRTSWACSRTTCAWTIRERRPTSSSAGRRARPRRWSRS